MTWSRRAGWPTSLPSMGSRRGNRGEFARRAMDAYWDQEEEARMSRLRRELRLEAERKRGTLERKDNSENGPTRAE